MNIGKQGELLFSQIMQGKGYEIKDVSNNPDYWYKDIDFILTSPTSGLTKTFEVKWDTRISKTGNLYLEFSNRHSKDCKGWFEFCEADYLAYGNAKANKFFVIPMDQLRERLANIPKRIAFCGNDSAGYLVHISQIIDIAEVLQ